MSSIDNAYKTKDLAEAGVLILRKIRLLNVEAKDNICWFIFDEKQECEKISKEFFFGRLLVDAREYQEVITRLKHKIFSLINKYGNSR